MSVQADEGAIHRRIIMLEAYTAAKEGAFDLYSYCSGVFPAEWQEELPDIVRKRAVEFALHARRAHEIANVSYKSISEIDVFLLKMSGTESIQIEMQYGDTLNMIIHSRFMQLHTVQRGPSLPKVFPNSKEELNLVFMEVETEHKSRRHLNLYGLAIKFLTEAAPKIIAEINKIIASKYKSEVGQLG